MGEYRLFWGETHDNTHQAPDPDFSMDEHLKNAAGHLDFYCGAYYPSTSPAFRKGGHPSEDKTLQPLNVETWKPAEQINREWQSVKASISRNNRENRFIAFPGFEWQGDGTWGDHNVFFNEEDPPFLRVDTLKELYHELRSHRAFAVPHHTAYIRGFRGKNWDLLDESISPFMEIYSIHGSSEGEQFGGGLRSNPFLGPDVSGGSLSSAIKRGIKTGIIASTDNWGPLPGHYGRGLAAVWAEKLTRASLWEAFSKRRVYGVSGDRIRLQFSLDDGPMGSVIKQDVEQPVFRVGVEALDRIDYVDFIRDEELIDRVSIFGKNREDMDCSDEYLFRIEYGWGPAANVLSLPPKNWKGSVSVKNGEITELIPCWISPGQGLSIENNRMLFQGKVDQSSIHQQTQNGAVIKIKGGRQTRIMVETDSEREEYSLEELVSGSRVIWNRKGAAELIRKYFSVDPEILGRKDVLFGMAYKTRIHQALPVSVYKKELSFTDYLFDGKPHIYRIRVRQRNGHMAWSSPIWLE